MSSAIWEGSSAVKGATESQRMILLTSCIFGLQLCWGLEMTYCMPYLLSLGLTKSGTSLVWIAGPLAGIVTAPTVGAVADKSRSKWGRRRPFMAMGAFFTVVGFYSLSSAKEIVQWVLGRNNQSATVALAVVSLWIVDFAITAVQWSGRALITDSLPTHKQQLGNLWASRMAAFGHLTGYAVGATDMKQVLGTWLGDTQFKQVAMISAFALVAGVMVTSWAVTERILITDGDDRSPLEIIVEVPRRIYTAARNMSPRMQGICMVQFFTWLGWFPFHFYGSTWVGEVYFRHEAPEHVKANSDRTSDIGRIGSLALMAFSVMQCLSASALPILVKKPDDSGDRRYTARPPAMLKPMLDKLGKSTLVESKPDLLTAWKFSHVCFAVAMLAAPFVTSLRAAATIVTICGLPWATMVWAPFTFMGMEINRHTRRHVKGDSVEIEKLEGNGSGGSSAMPSGVPAGTYLGILNLFTTGPQLLASLTSMVLFKLVEPQRHAHAGGHGITDKTVESREGPNAIAVCLFFSSFAGMAAAWAAHRLRRLYDT